MNDSINYANLILKESRFKKMESLSQEITEVKKSISDLTTNVESESINVRRLISNTNKEITMVERTLSSSIDNKIKNEMRKSLIEV
jgi:hypothetical protein